LLCVQSRYDQSLNWWRCVWIVKMTHTQSHPE
jgi:hypothetical protein